MESRKGQRYLFSPHPKIKYTKIGNESLLEFTAVLYIQERDFRDYNLDCTIILLKTVYGDANFLL